VRPIRRNQSPQQQDFHSYEKAQKFLISRLGSYCSYCERPVSTGLAVEHIQPKGLEINGIKPYEHLKGTWTNFLLACVNCNSTKGDKDVVLPNVLLPDRDNTFAAFAYIADGRIEPSSIAINNGLVKLAQDTLALTGLDKKISVTLDENGKQVAIDRVSQRSQAWLQAERSKKHIVKSPNNHVLKEQVTDTAKYCGFFSIWMKVFEDDADMRNRLIDAFAGTRESGCFDPVTTEIITPAPNPDSLVHGGKL
jgi:uncharacterized protein (TIGR02646 family)